MEGPYPGDPLPEQINPEIGEGITSPQIWVIPQGSRQPVYRQVFVSKRNNAAQAYQIIQPPAFQPIELSHGGPVWGYLFMGVILPRRPDLIYEEPQEHEVQRVAIKRLDLTVVNTELQGGSREDPYKEIWRMQTMGDNIHVIGLVEALQDDRFLYIITPWCLGGSLVEHIPLVPTAQMSIEAQARILFAQMLEDLEYIHEVHGICHRDVSPGNFLVSGNGRVLLSDLAMSFRMPASGIVNYVGQFGKPPYWIPEILTKTPFDARRCDLWACTITLYNLVTGFKKMYDLPYPPDFQFRYCIMARGISRDMNNEQVQEVMSEVHGGERYVLTAVAQRIATMSWPLLELFEKTLHLFADQRWTREDVLQCQWMTMGM
jgi:serine/threonine protein kinase